MKKIIYGILLMLLLLPMSVYADTVYRIDMTIDIEEDGTANIKEIWDVRADSGSEWYKTMYELGDSELSNYHVLIDGQDMVYKTWDIDESLAEKKGYYGINYASKGIELCFGKGDYQRHTYTITYTLSNYIFNTEDSQVLARVLLSDKGSVNKFTAVISGYQDFSDDLDVWGYGYKGYAYVSNGKIYMESTEKVENVGAILLVKFPLNYFNTTNTNSKYQTFNDVYEVVQEDAYSYDYSDEYYYDEYNDDSIFIITFFILIFALPFVIIIMIRIWSERNNYGYLNNKKIKKKEVPMFRDIPCNKDIYYANVLLKLNDYNYLRTNYDYTETNILGAIILKWVKEDKIGFKNEKKGIFNKDTSIIDLTKEITFTNKNEEKLFNILYEASGDGLLEAKELEKWCRGNYTKFFKVCESFYEDTLNDLKNKKLIYDRANRKECKNKHVMSDVIYEDSCKLYGLKKYLVAFSKMKTKEVMEVKLWDEYLMFAYLFGIADKVAKQLKDMYPEVLEQELGDNYFNYDMLIFVNNISMRSVRAATTARSMAQSYSSGGGGFSSGGGSGGFSSGGFSGGGGGSFGGR